MNIKLLGADFSANKIATIPVVNVVAKVPGRSVVNLGDTLTNGQKIAFAVIIDDVGSFSGSNVPFGFAVGSSVPGNIGGFMSGAPHFTATLKNGVVYVGEQEINGITSARPNVKLSMYNTGNTYYSVEWHIEYYIVS